MFSIYVRINSTVMFAERRFFIISITRDLRYIKPVRKLFIVGCYRKRKPVQVYYNRSYLMNYE